MVRAFCRTSHYRVGALTGINELAERQTETAMMTRTLTIAPVVLFLVTVGCRTAENRPVRIYFLSANTGQRAGTPIDGNNLSSVVVEAPDGRFADCIREEDADGIIGMT